MRDLRAVAADGGMTLRGLACPACGEAAMGPWTKAFSTGVKRRCQTCMAALQVGLFPGVIGLGMFVPLLVLLPLREGMSDWGLFGLLTLLLTVYGAAVAGWVRYASLRPLGELRVIRLGSVTTQSRCPFCHDDLALDGAVTCSDCNAGHHGECWDELGKCATCARPQRTAA